MKLKILGIILLLSMAASTGMAISASANGVPILWYIARASGIIGYILLYVLLISGMGLVSGFIYRVAGPVTVWRYHRAVGMTTSAVIMIHMVSLYLDKTMKFTLADLLIPYHSSFYPVFLSAGIIGFYLFIIITLTSIFLIKKSYKFWKLVHYLSYLLFVTILFHGIYLGSDTQTLTMQIIYWFTGITAIMGVIYRLLKSAPLFIPQTNP